MTLWDCDKLVAKGFYITIKNRGNITYILVGEEVSKNGSKSYIRRENI